MGAKGHMSGSGGGDLLSLKFDGKCLVTAVMTSSTSWDESKGKKLPMVGKVLTPALKKLGQIFVQMACSTLTPRFSVESCPQISSTHRN